MTCVTAVWTIGDLVRIVALDYRFIISLDRPILFNLWSILAVPVLQRSMKLTYRQPTP